ncbi:2-acylglycerol O-acyltransferase 2, partial [Galemys pyrenaicus]
AYTTSGDVKSQWDPGATAVLKKTLRGRHGEVCALVCALGAQAADPCGPAVGPLLPQTCIMIFIGLLFTRFWLISVLYTAWLYLDWDTPSKGGRSWKAARRSCVWNYMRDYFPISVSVGTDWDVARVMEPHLHRDHEVRVLERDPGLRGRNQRFQSLGMSPDSFRSWFPSTADLDPSRNYLAAYHPHGVLATGAFINMCTESTGFPSKFPGIRPYLMMLNVWFHIPIFRDYIMLAGLVASDKESAAHILNKKGGGNLLTIIIGGAQEALDARPGNYQLLLKNRKGFIRLALIHGVPLVPVYSFGENNVYDQVDNAPGSWLRWIQNRLQKVMSISLPLFHGRGIFQYSFGLIPHRRPINTVVGKPIEVEKTPNPSQEQVDQLHQHYMKELCNLFEAHKLKYNIPTDKHLEFY